MLGGCVTPRLAFSRRQIGDKHAAYTGFRSICRKAFRIVCKDWIVSAHDHNRSICLGTEAGDHAQYIPQIGAFLQGCLSGGLYGRAVSNRITKRNPHLDDVST